MSVAGLAWIPAGTRYGAEDITFYQGKGERSLDDVLPYIDLVITGPHATAAFPEELKPFVAERLTRRLQFDFTDITTSALARRWAELDQHVLYIENPHPRAVRDANRPRPRHVEAALREAFGRLVEAGEGGRPPLAGVDSTRPVTFAYMPVLRAPGDDAGWKRLAGALGEAGALGVDVYEQVRDELTERVVEAKCRRLVGVDPATLTAAELRSATTLLVLSIHDTMNHTARADGSISDERRPEDRLPNIVSLSNRGDVSGDARGSADGSLLEPVDVPTLDPGWLRAIALAYRRAFDAWSSEDVAFNRPYLGGHETQMAGPRLRELQPRTVVRQPGGATVGLKLGAFQNEFLRELLLGAPAATALGRSGDDWPVVPGAHIDDLAQKLKSAHDQVRRWGASLGTTGMGTSFGPPGM